MHGPMLLWFMIVAYFKDVQPQNLLVTELFNFYGFSRKCLHPINISLQALVKYYRNVDMTLCNNQLGLNCILTYKHWVMQAVAGLAFALLLHFSGQFSQNV